MTRLASVVLIFSVTASPVAAQSTPTGAPTRPASAVPAAPAPPPAESAVPDEGGRAPDVRRDLQEILRELPPSVSAVLRHDPSLLTRTDYLAPYPRLAAFLQAHPAVPLNPSYFIGRPDDNDPSGRPMRLAEDIFEGIGVMVIVGSIVGFFVWVVRTIVDHRRWLRLSKTQVEVHTKVLDRMSSHDDLLAYIQSPSGRRFLDSIPIETGGAPLPSDAALARVVWSLQAGIVLCAVGLGFWALGRNVLAEAGPGLSIISTLALALGLGFSASAGASYVISTRHGLIGREPRAQHE